MPIKTRKQALREALKRFGKKAAVQDGGWRAASAPEERESAKAELPSVRKQIAAIETRHKEELAPIYKRHREELADLKKREGEIRGIMHCRQYSVGTISDFGGYQAFSVKGEGDTWDEAFEKAGQ